MKSAGKQLGDSGYVQLYTGMGKGKTTAALGLALRAIGHGHRVFVGQFMKGIAYGEYLAAQDIEGLDIELFGEDTMVHPDAPRPEDISRAESGLKKTRQAMLSGEYQVVVLDEINVTVSFGILTEESVLELIEAKPDGVELILTGIRAPGSFIERADLVTEMVEIKHYYKEKNILSRKGIDR